MLQACSFAVLAPPARLDLGPIDLPDSGALRLDAGIATGLDVFDVSALGGYLRCEKAILPSLSLQVRGGLMDVNTDVLWSVGGKQYQDIFVASAGGALRYGKRWGSWQLVGEAGADAMTTPIMWGWSYSFGAGLGFTVGNCVPFVAGRWEEVYPFHEVTVRYADADFLFGDSTVSYGRLRPTRVIHFQTGLAFPARPISQLLDCQFWWAFGFVHAFNAEYSVAPIGFGTGIRRSF